MNNPFDLSGLHVLVTGASAGIGRETAILLSGLGARLLLVGRNEERLAETMASLRGGGHQALCVDLGEVDAIAGWVRQAALQHGPFNGLVHVAGIHRLLPLAVVSPAKVEELFRVNVTAGLMLLKGFRHKDCCTAPASAVLVSSVAALTGDPGAAPYAGTKAALLGITRSLAAELAPRIRVNCVVPGMVRTGMASQIEQVLGSEKMAGLESRHPLGFGEPADVAAGIAFLLSPAARWMTGSQLVMDGGYTAI